MVPRTLPRLRIPVVGKLRVLQVQVQVPQVQVVVPALCDLAPLRHAAQGRAVAVAVAVAAAVAVAVGETSACCRKQDAGTGDHAWPFFILVLFLHDYSRGTA